MTFRIALPLLAALGAMFVASPASSFVSAPVGGRAGDVDVSLRESWERGKVEPNEYPGSWQKARWEMTSFGAGYTFGDVGPLKDFHLRLDTSWYRAPAESSEPSNLVHPELGGVPTGQCAARVLTDGSCEFHRKDSGWLITPGISTHLVHRPDVAFGVFLQGTAPVGVDLGRFVLPRVDLVAGGLQLGVRVTPWLAWSSRIYVGSGASSSKGSQNAAVALTNLLVFETERWLLPWKAGVSTGTYFEGDLTERFDDAYDRAYTAAYPDRRDRIRASKFGVAFLPYFRVTDAVAVELGYVQKLFGYDAPATQLYYAGARAAF